MAEETPLRRFVRQFCASRIALIGVIVLAIIIIVAIAAPWIAPQNPYDLSKLDVLDSRLAPGEKAGDGMTSCSARTTRAVTSSPPSCTACASAWAWGR
jgi:peptide/nickel transport system permease protein